MLLTNESKWVHKRLKWRIVRENPRVHKEETKTLYRTSLIKSLLDYHYLEEISKTREPKTTRLLPKKTSEWRWRLNRSYLLRSQNKSHWKKSYEIFIIRHQNTEDNNDNFSNENRIHDKETWIKKKKTDQRNKIGNWIKKSI